MTKQAWRPSQGERISPAWQNLTKHLEQRLADLRQDNDKDKDEVATAKLRGQIAEVKRILELNKDLPTT